MKRLIVAFRLWRDRGLSYSWRTAWRKSKTTSIVRFAVPWEGMAIRLLTLLAIAGAFKFGVDVGVFVEHDRRVKQCQAQPNERLIATHQFPDGSILCEFGNGYGMALKRRKAS